MMVKIQAILVFPSLSQFVECILYFWKNYSIFIQNSLIFRPTLSFHTLLLYNLHCCWVKGWEERRSVFCHRLGFGTEGEETRDAGVRCFVYVSYVCSTLYVSYMMVLGLPNAMPEPKCCPISRQAWETGCTQPELGFYVSNAMWGQICSGLSFMFND